MDVGNLPMQSEQSGAPQAGQALNQQPGVAGQTSMFGQDVYMGVSISKNALIAFSITDQRSG